MKKIIVPTDFSPCASVALSFAVQISKVIPSQIFLLHAFDLKGNLYTDYLGVNKLFNQSQLHKVNEQLVTIQKDISQSDAIEVVPLVVTGSFGKSLIETVIERKIDLVIMGSSGASGTKEFFQGTHAAALIGKCPVPLLTIPAGYAWKKPQKILFTTNHFEKDPLLLDFIFELADLLLAQVHVIVFTNEQETEPLTLLEHTRSIPYYKKFLQDQYKEDSLVATEVFGHDFESALHTYIMNNEIDILTMVTYKRSHLDSFIHPSVTKKMSYHTTIPLLSLPST